MNMSKSLRWNIVPILLIVLLCQSQAVVSSYCVYDRDAITTLQRELPRIVVGQTRAIDDLLSMLIDHISSSTMPPTPMSKPLVLLLHGTTGTGKTYLSNQFASALLPTGNIIHFYGKMYPDPNKALQYLQEIQQRIIDQLRICPLTIFIFEEVQFMTPSILNDLTHFFHNNAIIDDADARQAIFILITNIGGEALQEIAYNAAKVGKQLSEVPYPEIAKRMVEELRKEDALRMLIKDGVIDRHIPFFPLLKYHVKQCFDLLLHKRQRTLRANKQIKSLEWDANVIEYGAAQLTYTGPISVYGCRPVDGIITSDLLPAVYRTSQRVPQDTGFGKYLGARMWNTKRSVVKLQIVKDKVDKDRVQTTFTPPPIQPAATTDDTDPGLFDWLKDLLH